MAFAGPGASATIAAPFGFLGAFAEGAGAGALGTMTSSAGLLAGLYPAGHTHTASRIVSAPQCTLVVTSCDMSERVVN